MNGPVADDDDQPWRDLLAATRADEMIASEGGEVLSRADEPSEDGSGSINPANDPGDNRRCPG
jgi:hypothetical protein